MKSKVKFYKKFISFFLVVMMIHSIGFTGVKTWAGGSSDTTAPTLTLTPSDGVLTDTTKSIQINVTASDSSGIQCITLPDGTVVNKSSTTYTVSNFGTYTFVAQDKKGNTTTNSTTIGKMDSCNGDWNLESVLKFGTSEADMMFRVGDIDNFGLNSPNFNPFLGNSDSHSFPFYPKDADYLGTDRIMVVSGYNSNYKTIGTNTDQYTQETSRSDNTVYKNSSGKYAIIGGHSYSNSYNSIVNDSTNNDNNVKVIDIDYSKKLKNGYFTDDSNNTKYVHDATIQMYVDDFQPGKAKGITADYGNVRYVAKMNDAEIPELSTVINSLDCSGPVARLITFQVPDRFLYLIRSGDIKIEIDDKNSNLKGDGYAIDFVKLLINKKGFGQTGIINGRVTDSDGGINGATVSLSVNSGVNSVFATTDPNGYYKLENVPVGQAVVTASAPHHTSQTLIQNVVANTVYNNFNFALPKHTSPMTPTITLATPPDKGYVKSNVATIVYSTGSQADPTIKQYRINKEGNIGEWTIYNGPFEVTENCTIQAEGINVYVDTVDTEKTEYTPSEIASLPVTNIDTTPPTLTLSQSPTTQTNGNVTINVTATDNIAIATTKWLAGTKAVSDFSNAGTVVNSNSFTVSANGTYTVYTIDTAGNAVVQTIIVGNIDTTPPTLTLTQSQTDGTVTISATATDNVAVASITKPDNTVVLGNSTTYPISGDGTYTFKATDTAGNITTKSIVISNLPVINANFKSYDPNPAKSTDEITLKYDIKADSFALPSETIDEAVVLEDMSKDMLTNSRWSMYQNGLSNQLITYLGNSNIKLGIVGYNDSVYIGSRENYLNEPKTCNLQKTDENLSNVDTTKFFPLYILDKGNIQDGYRQFYQEEKNIKNNISNNDTREFGAALKVADKVLTQYGTPDAKKAIIIISSGNLTYSSDAEIENIRNKGYKVITMDVSNSNSTNIKDTHIKLSGNQAGSIDNYYKGTFNDQSNYNSTDDDMRKIALNLKGEIAPSSLSIKDAKLNIDLGENFEAVNGGGLDGSGKTRTVTIPEINFTKNSTTGLWEQYGSVDVTFKVEPAEKKYGELGFGLYTKSDNSTYKNDSTISYTNFNSVLINKTIETPTITINNIVENSDTTPPTLTLTQSTENPKTIIAKASDSGSGVASITKPDKSIENFTSYPPEASVEYTVTTDGTYEFTATDKAGNKTTKSIPINTTASTAVKMEVSDSSGTINEKYDSTINDLDYNVDNNGEPYKLYGQSNVAINVQDANATHIKYRFVKDDQTPSENDWQYIALSGDVDNTKPGYLTQMPYDVSHMPLLNNEKMWSNRNEVYKTPFADKTGSISTDITDANTHYVTSENVRNKDGNMITRWVPRTLFVKNQSVQAYADGYKEARKTWGYIKADQTGDYYFKPYSDDGFYGTITVNGELKVLGDDFRPRGIDWSGLNATNTIHLEAGIYYPIYLEYFNWGGNAAFEIDASLNNETNYKVIGSSNSHCTLYPSKSDSPIENGNNIFMGSNTINFKTEPGIYTIQYALVKEKSTSTATQKEYDTIPGRSGSFGKFQVEERFEGLSKAFSKDRVQQGETFNINYTVKPKPIKLTDLYKGKDSGNKPNSIYVKNLILTDQLPHGLVTADSTNSTSINKVTDIEYIYNSQTSEYEANEYVFSVSVKMTSQNLDSINFTQSGQIDYRDVSLKDDSRISQTQYFTNMPNLGGNSLIIEHGLYNGNGTNIIEEKDLKDANGNPVTNGIPVTDGIPVTLAMRIEANSSNPVINISTDTSKITQGTIEFKMYKISDLNNDAIDTDASPTVVKLKNTGNINLSGLTMESGHKYLIVYSITPVRSEETIGESEKTTVTATADGTSSRPANLRISPKPDLF